MVTLETCLATLALFSSPAVQPLVGWRHMVATARRTCVYFSERMRALSDVHFPDAEQIRVVDNLNIHTPPTFYQVVEPSVARRLVQHFWSFATLNRGG
jgi:hypothetical protein